MIAADPEFVLRLRSSREMRLVEGRAGRATLPAGEYRLEGWTARRRDERGRVWEIRRSEDEPARVVRVAPGRVVPLPLASPAQPDLVIEQAGSQVAFRLRLVGAGKETLGDIRVDGRVVPPPSLRIADARGHTVARLAGDNRCGAGCAMVWRPPSGLMQPLRAIPEANLGPFPLTAAAFRFRLDDHPSLTAPSIGQAAPDFALPPASGGAPIRLSSLRGRPALLCFFCGCGDCQAAAKRLAPEAAALGARTVAVVENARQLRPDQISRFRRVSGFTSPVLADRGGAVTRRYSSANCPRVWALDRAGIIRYVNADPHASPADMARRIRRALGE